MKRWKTRHKVLLGLMLTVTAVMIGCHIHTAIWYSKPESEINYMGWDLKSLLFLNTSRFIPIYLGVFILWFLIVTIAEANSKHE